MRQETRKHLYQMRTTSLRGSSTHLRQGQKSMSDCSNGDDEYRLDKNAATEEVETEREELEGLEIISSHGRKRGKMYLEAGKLEGC